MVFFVLFIKTPHAFIVLFLLKASYFGFSRIASLLLEYGANVSITNDDGLTPLHEGIFV